MAIEGDQARARVQHSTVGWMKATTLYAHFVDMSVQLKFIAINNYFSLLYVNILRICRALNNPLSTLRALRVVVVPFVPSSLSSHDHDPPILGILEYRDLLYTAYYSGRGLFIDTTLQLHLHLHLHLHLQLYHCPLSCPGCPSSPI